MVDRNTFLKLTGLLAVVAVLAAGSGFAQTAEETTLTGGQRILTASEEKQSFLGVNIWEVKPEIAREKGLPEERGIVITSVMEGSAAARAGLKKGDVVLEFNGRRVEGVKQFVRLVRETPAGRPFEMKLVRDGEEMSIAGTMGEKPSMFALDTGERRVIRVPELREIVIPDIPHVYTTWRSARLGVVAESLEPQLAEYFGVKEGVLIRSVGEDTPAARAGLSAGDVITAAGEVPVTTPREVSSAIQSADSNTVRLTVVRERRTIQVDVNVTSATGGGESQMQRLVLDFDEM